MFESLGKHCLDVRLGEQTRPLGTQQLPTSDMSMRKKKYPRAVFCAHEVYGTRDRDILLGCSNPCASSREAIGKRHAALYARCASRATIHK